VKAIQRKRFQPGTTAYVISIGLEWESASRIRDKPNLIAIRFTSLTLIASERDVFSDFQGKGLVRRDD
jgi:hypothetical protein